MKRILLAVVVGIVCLPIRADAHGCGVSCHQQVAILAAPLILSQYPYSVGTPAYVAEAAPVNYSYVNPQPINVTVNNAPIDSAALANAIQTGIVQGLSAPPPNQPTPAASPVPTNPQPAPTQPAGLPKAEGSFFVPGPTRVSSDLTPWTNRTPEQPAVTIPKPQQSSGNYGPTPPVPSGANTTPTGLFQEQSCIRCHGGGNAKATAAVDMRAALTCAQKLACIQAIVAGTMPKGAPLSDPNAAGKLITQLSAP